MESSIFASRMFTDIDSEACVRSPMRTRSTLACVGKSLSPAPKPCESTRTAGRPPKSLCQRGDQSSAGGSGELGLRPGGINRTVVQQLSGSGCWNGKRAMFGLDRAASNVDWENCGFHRFPAHRAQRRQPTMSQMESTAPTS